MNKNVKRLVLSLSVLIACSCSAFADGNAFTPLNFEDAYTNNSSSIRTTATTTSAKPVNTVNSTARTNVSGEPAGNAKMQNAIIQLDNAQVDVRNELLNYKTKYSDVDARYTAIKAERKALDKEVKSLERRIKKIDKQKENIRKNML